MKKETLRVILAAALGLAGCGGEPERSRVVPASDPGRPPDATSKPSGAAQDKGKIPMH
jgi:hypothetical protein